MGHYIYFKQIRVYLKQANHGPWTLITMDSDNKGNSDKEDSKKKTITMGTMTNWTMTRYSDQGF